MDTGGHAPQAGQLALPGPASVAPSQASAAGAAGAAGPSQAGSSQAGIQVPPPLPAHPPPTPAAPPQWQAANLQRIAPASGFVVDPADLDNGQVALQPVHAQMWPTGGRLERPFAVPEVFVQNADGAFRKVRQRVQDGASRSVRTRATSVGAASVEHLLCRAVSMRAAILDHDLVDLNFEKVGDRNILAIAVAGQETRGYIEGLFSGVQGMLAGICFVVVGLLYIGWDNPEHILPAVFRLEPALSSSMFGMLQVATALAALRVMHHREVMAGFEIWKGLAAVDEDFSSTRKQAQIARLVYTGIGGLIYLVGVGAAAWGAQYDDELLWTGSLSPDSYLLWRGTMFTRALAGLSAYPFMLLDWSTNAAFLLPAYPLFTQGNV